MTTTRINVTFGRDDPTWANACVGNNGAPSYLDYAKGFSRAANLLIDTVLQDGSVNYYVDELVYPVCFNMRHSVELRLKAAIIGLSRLEKFRERSLRFDLEGSHDIGNIWQFFVSESNRIDDRFMRVNDQLDSLIMDIADIDATGQTFRYPYDTEEQKHLVSLPLINFFRLKRAFTTLESNLDELNRLLKYLREEYAQGTITKQLSRNNIFEIARMLPARDHWQDPSFDLVKEAVKNKYAIGSKDYSECLTLIQGNYELAPIIGIKLPLRGIQEHELLVFADHWHQLFDPLNQGAIAEGFDFESWKQGILRDAEIEGSIWATLRPTLTPQYLAGLHALFYFARELDFSEKYVRMYESELSEMESMFSRTGNGAKMEFFHLLNKKNAMENIIKSLYFLKKSELADRLVTAYKLETVFEWIPDARSGVLFRR